MNHCSNCGAIDFPPFYTCWKSKRKRYNEKDTLYCPVCKSVMTAGSDMGISMIQEEREKRQVGKPCVHANCKGIYQPKTAYFEISVCKVCSKPRY